MKIIDDNIYEGCSAHGTTRMYCRYQISFEGVTSLIRKGIVRISKSLVLLAMSGVLVLSPVSAVTAQAAYVEGVEIAEDAYETLRKGTKKYNGVDYGAQDGYDPVYYYLNYADLREAFGADPEKLVEHWAVFGKKEKRVCNKLVVRNARLGSSSYEYVVPSNAKTSDKKDGMTIIPGEIHSNGGMTRNQEDQARSIAKQIAQHVFTQVRTKGKGTQIEMVAYATGIVHAYCDLGTYTTEGKIYRTAYGVFIGHEYSCAGSTRALGLVLDYLDQLCEDYNKELRAEAERKAAEEAKKKEEAAKKAASSNSGSSSSSSSSSSASSSSSSSASSTKSKEYPPLRWVHVNANKWDDQWCQIVCDNHEAYADPISEQAGYGKHPNHGGKKKDAQSYYKYAGEIDIITTVPQYIDGQDTIYMDHQYNKVN